MIDSGTEHRTPGNVVKTQNAEVLEHQAKKLASETNLSSRSGAFEWKQQTYGRQVYLVKPGRQEIISHFSVASSDYWMTNRSWSWVVSDRKKPSAEAFKSFPNWLNQPFQENSMQGYCHKVADWVTSPDKVSWCESRGKTRQEPASIC